MVLGKGGARAVVGTKGVTLEAAAPTCASAPELKAVAGAACVWGEPDTVALASLAPDGALRFCLEHQGRCLAFDPATGAFSRLQVVAGPKADPLGWPALQAAAPSGAFDVETPGVTIRARDSGKVIATIEPGSAGATLLKAPWLDADRLLVIGYVGASGYGDARVFEAKSGRLLYTVKGNAVGTRFAHLKGDEWVNLVDDIDAGRHHFDRVSFATGKLLQRVTFKPPSAELARLEADESRAFAVYANGVVVTLAKGKVRLSTPARCQ
jgi:hypothetical protein